MNNRSNYKIVLFGLSGFGSYALQYLINLDVNIKNVYTRKEKFKHPYFPVRSVDDLAKQYKIPCSYNIPNELDKDIDLIICSSYHKIIPENLLTKAKLGAFNLHPSLLPSYKGATPTKQCLLNNETASGITLHKMTKNFDEGEIIAQEKLKIKSYFDDGLLRQHLSILQYKLILKLFEYLNKKKQLERKSYCYNYRNSYYPPFKKIEVNYNANLSIYKLLHQIRASSPFPGLLLKINNKKYNLTKVLGYKKGINKNSVIINKNTITIKGLDGQLKAVYR